MKSENFIHYFSEMGTADINKLAFISSFDNLPKFSINIGIDMFPKDLYEVLSKIKTQLLNPSFSPVYTNYRSDKEYTEIPSDLFLLSDEISYIDYNSQTVITIDYAMCSSALQEQESVERLTDIRVFVSSKGEKSFTELVNAFLEVKKDYYKEIKEEKTFVQMLLFDSNGNYHSHEVPILSNKFLDIELNYGESFVEKNEIIKESLINKTKGIVLLHGLPGTGKSTYIKYLISSVKKDFVILNLREASKIDTPELTYWLLNNQGKVIIIEEAEKLILSREEDHNASLAGILNLSDGITADAFRNPIIMTFNTKRENIDKALLRKGRLICEHEFLELSTEDSNRLFKHLGQNVTTSDPMVITDIYNFHEKAYNLNKPKNSIGF